MKRKRIFGTAGARGFTNTEITPEFALKISASYGIYLNKTLKKEHTVAVGFDTRFGAQMLANICQAGLLSVGVNVIDLGCISSGGFSINLVKQGLAGGILITGSHMPPDRIGIIIVQSNGTYAPFDVTDKIETLYYNFDKQLNWVAPENIGSISHARESMTTYIRETLRHLDKKPIISKRFRILIDSANGTGALLARDFFEELGCEVYEVNGKTGPTPKRKSEPRAANVREAMDETLNNKCDIGICLDVDADRVLFITADGEAVSEDTTGAIFANSILTRWATCVTPINSSGLIEFVCRGKRARLEYCTIGQAPIVKAIKKFKAVFAYEESGKYYFPHHFLWCDGIFAAAKMLEIMAKGRKTLAALAREFPRFYQVKHTLTVKDAQKESIMRRVKKSALNKVTASKLKDLTIDGFKRIYKDNSWLLIRKSGTEPLIRVYSDAPSMKRAEELVKNGVTILKGVM